MEDYKIVDGKVTVTPQMKVKRFFSRYPEVSKDINFNVLKMVYSEITEVSDLVLVTYNDEIKSEVLASLLMRNKIYENLVVFNSYALIDIFLGNNEEISSLLDIDRDIVSVYSGYNEFDNKRAQDVVLQLADQQKVHNRKFWFLYKGNDIREKFPLIYRYFSDNKGLIYNISGRNNSSEEEII